MTRHWVWIVEGNFDPKRRLRGWHPTVGIGLTKQDAQRAAQDWRARNPDDSFRVRRYVAAQWGMYD